MKITIKNRKAGIVGWYLLAIFIMFGIVFWGLMGNQVVTDNEEINCTRSFGILCITWEDNESMERGLERDDEDDFYVTDPW
ncbi:MAG: hypothetical protein ACLFTR_05375 [Candidatus Woesearchaeota archaeon]